MFLSSPILFYFLTLGVLRSFLISIIFHKREKYKLCDLVVVPKFKNLGFVNYKRVEDYVAEGYRAVKETFSKI